MDLWPLLTEEARRTLNRAASADLDRARRSLEALGARAGPPSLAVPLLEAVIPAAGGAADPERALLNFARWSAALPSPAVTFRLLREDPRLAADLARLFGASEYLAEILIRDPWLHGLFTEPAGPRDLEAYRALVAQGLQSVQRAESRTDVLRRIKRREFLRIGWRDLCRDAPLEETVREISDLADALIEGALRLARQQVEPRYPSAAAEVRLAVLALGKLGARELNYSSDIDLVFVMESPHPQDEVHRRYATRLAEAVVQELGAETGEGRCFRVDLRLRPEGRSGALVRSLGAFRTYYDRWAETWERQALLKARPVAGDRELGEQFMQLARRVSYRRWQGATLLEDVREMRGAVERKLEATGGLAGHVKEGRGTIREVEFPVQLLQLFFGADVPSLQVPDTLTALARLAEAGLLHSEEAALMTAGYRFFRVVEHRLQLLNDLPVRRLPTDARELTRLARSLPVPPCGPGESPAEAAGFTSAAQFQEAYDGLSAGVHALAEAIYARLGAESGAANPLREALLTADLETGAAVLAEELRTRGFPAPEEALPALARLAAGPPQAPHPAAIRRLFADLAPALLDACMRAADPTLALRGMADLAERKVLYRAHFQTLLDYPAALDALCRVAGTAPAAWSTVLRFPELSEVVTDAELLRRRPTRAELASALRERLAEGGEFERGLSVLRRFKLREWVRMAARHVLFPVPIEAETEEWSDLAEVLLAAALEHSLAHLRARGRWPHPDPAGLAICALGRFGGRDLHFASDLDLLYVYDPEAGGSAAESERAVRTLTDALGRVGEEGRLFETDLRLRPEGRQGAQVVSIEALRRYYRPEGRAETWEYQALTRLRPVAGSDITAARLADVLRGRVYGGLAPERLRGEIRAMRRRIERERVGDTERARHLKLGPGGLVEIEFLVQYLQLCRGGAEPAFRTTSTLAGLEALRVGDPVAGVDPAELRDAFLFLTRLRQTLALLDVPSGPDLLPYPGREPRWSLTIARALGFRDAVELEVAFRVHKIHVRGAFFSVFGREPDATE